LDLGWIIRERDSRALRVTELGKTGLSDTFGVDLTSDRLRQADIPSGTEARLRA
jgi:hypothetical protein